MKTSPDCLACFLRQAQHTARLINSSRKDQQQLMDQVVTLINNFDLNTPPPVNSVAMYELLSRLSGVADPFAALKQQSNLLALAQRARVREIIRASQDPLLTAIIYAIAANIIDYGSHQHFDLQATLAGCLAKPLAINDYQALAKDLRQAENVLYLGDNCGEIVFDSLLMEQLPGQVTLALKERPIINDALPIDAAFCGLEMSRVISNGTGCPGTPFELCSPEFQALFKKADLIISKGQGNFETLSECRRPIYFLFTVKCQVVARHAAALAGLSTPLEINDPVLLKLPAR